MGTNLINCEKLSSGQIAKICNNATLAIQMISVAESCVLGRELGIDLHLLHKVFAVSTAQSASTKIFNPIPDVIPDSPSSNNYQPGFAVDLMLKDINIAIECADSLGFNMKILKKCKKLFQKASDAGDGAKDFSIVYKYIEPMV